MRVLLGIVVVCVVGCGRQDLCVVDCGAADPCSTNAGDFSGPTTTDGVSLVRRSVYRYLATWFVADGNAGAICGALLEVERVGSPTGNLYASIWIDNTSVSPSVPLEPLGPESAAISADAIDGRGFIKFTGMKGTTIASGAKYWLVMRSEMPVDDENNYVFWLAHQEAIGANAIVNTSATDQPWESALWHTASFKLTK